MKKMLLIAVLFVAVFSAGCSSISKGYVLEAQIRLLTLDEIDEMRMNGEIEQDKNHNDLIDKKITYDGMKALTPPTLDEIADKKENSTNGKARDLYRCEIVIKEITYDGDEATEKTISAPRITFFDGQKAAVSVADEKADDGVFAEVIVNDKENDGYSNIDVHVKDKGKTLTHTKFRFKLK